MFSAHSRINIEKQNITLKILTCFETKKYSSKQPWVKKEIIMEFIKYLELSNQENVIYKDLRIRGKFITLNE